MVAKLFAEDEQLQLTKIVLQGDSVTFQLTATASSAACPKCGDSSTRIHSWYSRQLQDLPWQAMSIPLTLAVRRFFCDNLNCSGQVFCERLRVAKAYARTTGRLCEIHTLLGLVLGGEPGSRVARTLTMPTSADTLLRRVRTSATSEAAAVRVLGVDDFAFRKGHTYGTILCDLEKGTVIDLLPDRTAESLTAWLAEHPEVEIISRDRASAYANAAETAAPQAQQVADRFHLLQNVQQALQRMLDRQRKKIQPVLAEIEAPQRIDSPEDSPSQEPTEAADEPAEASAPTLAELRLRKLYEQAHQLHAEGDSIREIARRLKLARNTVRRYLRSETFPARPRQRLGRGLQRFCDYLRGRIRAGCQNASRLYREIVEQGYTGSINSVRRHVRRLRQEIGIAKTSAKDNKLRKPKTSAATLSWLLIREPEQLNASERELTQRLREQIPTLDRGIKLATEFREMIRQQQSGQLEDWLGRAKCSDITEWKGFAKSIKKDQQAVQAALDLKWSNGPVEGHVNRLKLIKRQMYGRANFDLLRARVIHRE